MIGYIGAALIAASYMMKLPFMLTLQLAGTICLGVYASSIHSQPFLMLELVCFVALVFRIVAEANYAAHKGKK